MFHSDSLPSSGSVYCTWIHVLCFSTVSSTADVFTPPSLHRSVMCHSVMVASCRVTSNEDKQSSYAITTIYALCHQLKCLPGTSKEETCSSEVHNGAHCLSVPSFPHLVSRSTLPWLTSINTTQHSSPWVSRTITIPRGHREEGLLQQHYSRQLFVTLYR